LDVLPLALKRNYLLASPAENVERFRLPERSLPKFMTAEELQKFFGACGPWKRRAFSILLLARSAGS
jgi:hypothetical protein